MSTRNPAVILFDASGNPLAVQPDTAIPASTPALMIAGTDGSKSQYMLVDASGRPIVDINKRYDITGEGTIDALNETVSIIPMGCSGANISISGTWVGTLIFETTIDNSTWFTMSAVDQVTAAFVTSTTANSNLKISVAGYKGVRVRASAWTSGTATITMVAGPGAMDLSFVSAGTVPSEVQGVYASDLTNSPKPVIIGGKYPTTGVLKYIAIDSEGRIIISPAGSISVVAGFNAGYITTSDLGTYLVNATTYTEQTTNAQRSIASSSASDTAAGTGLRTLTITYYDQTGAGPYTETLTLSGTTGVNTVASNICFIEKILGDTVGSNNSNVGTITLYSAINKGGVAIGTIVIGDNRTFWAHHYVPIDKTCYVTSHSVSHNGTTVGSGAVFIVKTKAIPVANQVEYQITDFIRLYGQSSTISRNYGTAIKVTGPKKISVYVLPESASSLIYRSAFDFYDQ